MTIPSIQLECLAMTAASSRIDRAFAFPCRRRCSTAMKCLFPLLKLPCR
jgi:hypothetical protein